MDKEKRDAIGKAVTEIELAPSPVNDDFDDMGYEKIPFERLASLGVAFEPLRDALFQVAHGSGGSGIYQVTVPAGKTMATFRDGRGFLGSVLTEQGTVGGGQAVINPVTINPTMIFMAVALHEMDKKLTDIQETQQDIMDFLIQKEKSELKGDLYFLQDVMDNYKFNWNNDQYKRSNHIKVLDIKQESERKVDFYREQIKSRMQKKNLINRDADIKKQVDKLQDLFSDYQLSLYLFSYSSFLEVILLENYDTNYLQGITNKIDNYSYHYRELYTKCYDRIESSAKSSVESFLLKGFAAANVTAGKTVKRIPVNRKLGIDETFIRTGAKVQEFNVRRTEKKLELLINNQISPVHVFKENIYKISQIHNEPMELAFDVEGIYVSR